jgi:hypothetical protein
MSTKPKNIKAALTLAQIGRGCAEAIIIGQAIKNMARMAPNEAQRELAQQMTGGILQTNESAVTALELQLLSCDAKMLRRLLKGMLAAVESQNTNATLEG